MLALQTGTSKDPADQGWEGLVRARLRALRGLRLVSASAGCAGEGVTHTLGLSRRATDSSEITAFQLTRCASGQISHQSFVTPREARRDWSAAAAWWVAQELGLAHPERSGSKAIGERAMLRYLSAIGHLARRTAADVDSARKLLREAVREEAGFAAGHAELAVAELLASEYGLASTEDALTAADQAISRALELDPDNGVAMAASGLAAMIEGRYREAVPILLEAHAREPGHDAILLWLGNAQLYSGQVEAARPWLQSVLAINPELGSARISLGEADCLSGAEAACREFLTAPASTPMQSYVTALLQGHRGDYAAAVERLERDRPEVDPSWVAGLRGDACRALARAECARPASSVARDALPEADLWQLDLGYSGILSDPKTRVAHADALLAEVQHLRAGGIRLAVLDAIVACLGSTDRPTTDPALERLIGCTLKGEAAP